MAENASAAAGADEIRRLEGAAAAAWPPREIEPLDGWLLFASGGGTRRTQSVQPIDAGELDLDVKIDACEQFYAERRQACVFRLTPVSDPPELDRRLHDRGYLRSDETCVQTASLADAPRTSKPERVVIDDHPGPAWLARGLDLGQTRPEDSAVHEATLMRAAQRVGPTAFARIELDGEIAALGFAAIEDGDCFVGEIATDTRHRRKGLASEVVRALMAWGRDAGATEALLQVVAANAPARRLYGALGFVDRYAYWYRARPTSSDRVGATVT